MMNEKEQPKTAANTCPVNICQNCGRKIRRDAAYCMRRECQNAHRRNWWRQRERQKRGLEDHCANCGKPIRRGTTYCGSRECQNKYQREYKRNRYRNDPEYRRRIIDSASRYQSAHPRSRQR